MLESFDASGDPQELLSLIETSKDYIFNLTIRQLLSHINLKILFNNLPNLVSLNLTYGANKLGMAYERSLFGMKPSDAMSLANSIASSAMLVSLTLKSNLINDELLSTLACGLEENNTIVHVDLSHNEIANKGARILARLLSREDSCITSLVLCDNQIHADGGKYFGRALKVNGTLQELDLRLNRLSDEGGALLFDGLIANKSLSSLNVSCNCLGASTAKKCIEYLKADECALAFLDVTANEFTEEACERMEEVSSSNLKIDARGNDKNKFTARVNKIIFILIKVVLNTMIYTLANELLFAYRVAIANSDSYILPLTNHAYHVALPQIDDGARHLACAGRLLVDLINAPFCVPLCAHVDSRPFRRWISRDASVALKCEGKPCKN